MTNQYSELSLQEGVYSCLERQEAGTWLSIAAQYIPTSAWIICHTYGTICFGRWDGKQAYFPEQSVPTDTTLVQCRLFNDTSELFLQRRDTNYQIRYISDSEGNSVSYCDTITPIDGTAHPLENDAHVTLIENPARGSRFLLPFHTEAMHYGLVVRNYVSHLPTTGQASLTHYRYVTFTPTVEMK